MAASESASEQEVEVTSTVLHLNEIFVFRPPPRASAQGWAAGSFGIDKPLFTGELKIMTHGEQCMVRLYKKPTADKGDLTFFAGCPIKIDFGGKDGRRPARPVLQQLEAIVEPVVDSSRYFVLRVEDERSGRRAFLAFGVADRADAFSFKSALQDHVRYLERQREADARAAHEAELEAKAAAGDTEAEKALNAARGRTLDLGLKEGQTIKIDSSKLRGKGRGRGARARANGAPGAAVAAPGGGGGSAGGGGGLGLLAPPPPPPSATAAAAAPSAAAASNASAAAGAEESGAAGGNDAEGEDEDWGDFQ